MCDYSLGGIENRLAEDGEELVVHRFTTGSKGLTSPEYLRPRPAKGLAGILGAKASIRECAVCIPDGAKLMIDVSKYLQEIFSLSFSTEMVTFRQLSSGAMAYRDALEFADGYRILLQELGEGQRLQVLSTSSSEESVPRRQKKLVVVHG